MTLGERIKQIRKSKGITQRDLANKIEKSFSLVQKYEMGLTEPPYTMLMKIATALDVPITELLGITQNTMAEAEKAELVSIGEALKPTDSEMFRFNCNAIESCMEKMNRLGQSTAVKLVKELSETPEFQILPKKKPGQK